MSNITIQPNRIQGEIIPPADKSISHRAVIIASIAQGKTKIKNLSACEDCLCTINAFRRLGIAIKKSRGWVEVWGRGLSGLRKPKEDLYLGNSGTSMRLILGVLAGQRFASCLKGDASLSRRPMERVVFPLSLMGAKIVGEGRSSRFAPLTIHGGKLVPLTYRMPIASAQVKSAILLAALYAQGSTVVQEPAKSRDHTERMLASFGANIYVKGLTVRVQGRANLVANNIDVPGDISAASFFLVGACIVKGSQLTVKSVGLNSTRTAFLDILQRMGARLNFKYHHNQMANKDYQGEARGNINARHSYLKAIEIKSAQIPALIDELPVLMVAATQSAGTTLIQGAGELRVKESDRIEAMVANLSKMGADIKDCDNAIIIRGPTRLLGATVDSFNDHRIAMSMAVAALAAQGRTVIKNADCVKVSFPKFFISLASLI